MAIASYTHNLPDVTLEMSVNEARALLEDLEEFSVCQQSERVKNALKFLLEG